MAKTAAAKPQPLCTLVERIVATDPYDAKRKMLWVRFSHEGKYAVLPGDKDDTDTLRGWFAALRFDGDYFAYENVHKGYMMPYHEDADLTVQGLQERIKAAPPAQPKGTAKATGKNAAMPT